MDREDRECYLSADEQDRKWNEKQDIYRFLQL